MPDQSPSRRAARRLRALAVLAALAAALAGARRRAMEHNRVEFEARYGPGGTP